MGTSVLKRVRSSLCSISAIKYFTSIFLLFSVASVSAAVPTITTFTPGSGPIGTTVTITGTNFSATVASDTVKFHGTTATTIVSASTTQIVAVVPAGATSGTISVTVGTNGTATSTSSFSVTAPTITSFTPGSAGSGATVTITGTNYSATPANNSVKFNGIQSPVTSASSTQLVTSVPSGATTGKITVAVLSSPVATSSATFTLLPNPTITSFSATSGGVGASVTIIGTNFSATKTSDTVKFNGTLASITTATATQLVVVVPTGATTGQITVAVANVPTSATSSGTFTVLPPPTISNFTPSSGPIGTTVTITGTNFVASPLTASTVKFNGKQATVASASTTQLVVTVPTGTTTGLVTVTVSTLTATGGTYTVTTPPTITSFTPTSGAVGTSVTITGTNYSTTVANDTVSFGGVSAQITSATSTHIVAIVPDTATTGSVSITVSGQGTATSTSSYTVTTPPLVITSFSPGSALVGASVTLNGTGFSVHAANDQVTFSGIPGTITSASPTKLVVTIPNAPTNQTIGVTVGGQTVFSSGALTINWPPPTITSFSPLAGPVGGSVIINGTWFNPVASGNNVIFQNSNYAVTILSASQTQLQVAVPVESITGSFSVSTANGTAISPSSFTVTSPYITGMSPSVGPPGTSVVLTGANFSSTASENSVAFNFDEDAVVTAASPTQLTVVVPDNADISYDYISVVNGNGEGQIENFQVTPHPPLVTGFQPTSAPVGTTIEIDGNYFNAVLSRNAVSFNGVAATLLSATPNQITATVPTGTTTGPISVTVASQSGTSTNNFTVSTAAPTVASFSPPGGPQLTTITITGTNFSPTISDNLVTIGGVPVTLSSATTTTLKGIYGYYGGQTLTTAPVQVVVAGQTASSSTSFVVSALAPTITSFSPSSGPAGIPVQIVGQNFVNTAAYDQVKLNGVGATVVSATPTSVVAIIPSGAASGPLSLAVSNGTATSATNFNVTGAPSGDQVVFSPTSGPVGTTVKILGFPGANFGPDTTILFNGTAATTTNIDYSLLTEITYDMSAVVPVGATSGPIKLSSYWPSLNQTLTAQSPTSFYVTTSTANVAVGTPTAEPSVVGQSYTVPVTVIKVPPATQTPTGSVTVSDGTNDCQIVLPSTSCSLPGSAVGQVALTATYSGDSVYGGGVGQAGHIINPVTATEVCGIDPWTIPNDPPGFVPLQQLSGIAYSPGIAASILGTGNFDIVSTNYDGCIGAISPECTGTNGGLDVTGVYDGPSNTGFSANGKLGYTSHGKFLIPGGVSAPSTIVTAVTLDGRVASTSFNNQPAAAVVHMIPATKFAPAPASISFSYDVSAVTVSSITVSFGTPSGPFGNGYTGSTLLAAAVPSTFTYSSPGLYSYEITVLTTSGLTYTDVGSVMISDPGEQRGVACDVFSYLKNRLQAQDAAGAASTFQPIAQPQFLALFTSLGSNMPTVAQQLGYIANGFFGAGYWDLMLVRDNANQTRSGYPMRITQGSDGVWRISEM